MSDIRIGTCGYSYPGAPPKGWDGVFYPAERRRGFDELSYYADFFDTVEINSSFYRPPAPAMARAWAAKTPDGFEFSVKAWQKFTHATRLGEPGAARERRGGGAAGHATEAAEGRAARRPRRSARALGGADGRRRRAVQAGPRAARRGR